MNLLQLESSWSVFCLLSSLSHIALPYQILAHPEGMWNDQILYTLLQLYVSVPWVSCLVFSFFLSDSQANIYYSSFKLKYHYLYEVLPHVKTYLYSLPGIIDHSFYLSVCFLLLGSKHLGGSSMDPFRDQECQCFIQFFRSYQFLPMNSTFVLKVSQRSFLLCIITEP